MIKSARLKQIVPFNEVKKVENRRLVHANSLTFIEFIK